MMSRIGNKHVSFGFSLIEIMVAVSVLSVGTVLVLESNMMSLDVFGRYLNRLEILRWANEKISETKASLIESESPSVDISSGSIKTDRRDYGWQLEIKDSDIPDLYSIHLDVSWDEASRTAHLYRDAYLLKIKR
ncbi:MAG: prepilin-type N-terminal cleavage/methylation domain-containing protein [Candidatus Omnitrophica bacterium]|nr:prepilin-type N-terminal cleavage/methylation domain-containing protein [Candidatus Omnitrophota bacterium]